MAQGCEDRADGTEEQIYPEGETEHNHCHHHHHHHHHCCNVKVVKEDMFKYSTTKLGKAMEKVQWMVLDDHLIADADDQ